MSQNKRLINEKSPYLLQHANNPVEWYPWCDEAFEKAKEENKPIFLSIGYSTCHWCHVMEKESFEDEEVAAILNKNFISIKVDREERPDIDNIYMTFCQSIMGQGGWPLSVFLTCDKQPFYAGTYFPKDTRNNYIGFVDLLNTIIKKWMINKDEIEYSAKEMTDMINNIYSDMKEEELEDTVIDRAFEYLDKRFDSKYGGFGNAPKFPTPHNLLFLLRYYYINNNKLALEMVEKTLIQMYKGGIFDHVGFGFSRYSTDIEWLVPHFEKMLYDNALLLIAYIETYQLTKKIIYKEIAEKIITYVIRDMTTSDGAFLCAEDADSEGVEGKYYIWEIDEIVNILGEEDANIFFKHYNITSEGNFENKNIPNLINTKLHEIENDFKLKSKLELILKKLFEQRIKRIKPHKDDKILSSWNALMIVALARAGKVFSSNEYLDYSKNAIEFIEKNLFRADGRLFSRFRDGEAKHLAYIDDYAFLIWGYIELYESVFDTRYIRKAIKLTNDMIDIFMDNDSTGFFMYGKDSEKLITRPKEIYDGAIPSGNSVATYNLLKLAKLTGNIELEKKVNSLFAHFGSKINESPIGHSFMLISKMFADQPTKEIVLVSSSVDENKVQDFLGIINNLYLPFSIVLLIKEDRKMGEINEFVQNYIAIDDKTTAYVCENFTCQKPETNIEKFRELLSISK